MIQNISFALVGRSLSTNSKYVLHTNPNEVLFYICMENNAITHTIRLHGPVITDTLIYDTIGTRTAFMYIMYISNPGLCVYLRYRCKLSNDTGTFQWVDSVWVTMYRCIVCCVRNDYGTTVLGFCSFPSGRVTLTGLHKK